MRNKDEFKGIFIAIIVIIASFNALFIISDKAMGYTSHNPIFILENADFIAINGVTGGNGTPLDPFIIEGWQITDASSADGQNYGIYMRDTSACFIIRNVYVHIPASPYGGYGIVLKNVCNGVVRNSLIDRNMEGGISIYGSTNITITQNTISDHYSDFWISSSNNISIIGNTISNSPVGYEYGFYCSNSRDIIILDNEIIIPGEAFVFYDSDNIEVRRNNISGGSLRRESIILSNSINFTIAQNHISVGNLVLKIDFCYNFFITTNNILSTMGIESFHSESVVIRNNSIRSTHFGIMLNDSFNMLVYHNNFLGNPAQYHAFDDVGAANSWDNGYPSGGNYWSDYTGVDGNSDGIGDTPYIIDSNSYDNYPLMNPTVRSPDAHFVVSPMMGGLDTIFTVNASTSWDLEDMACILEVRWDWEDDGSWDTNWSTVKAATHQYSSFGNFTIRFEVRDSDGLTNQSTEQVIVYDTPPNANAGADRTVDEDSLVFLNGSASMDDIGIMNYTWTFIDGTVQTLWGVNQSHIFDQPDVYFITLNVTDTLEQWDTDIVKITVRDITSPVANAGADQTVNEDTMTIFNGNNSTDNVGITNYSWIFLDGDVQMLEGMGPTYIFTQPGIFIVTLEVRDAWGNIDSDTVNITVCDITPPVAAVQANLTVNEDTLITFDGSNSTDNVGIDNYTWTFYDNGIKTLYGIRPSYIFNETGIFLVTLNVTDVIGYWDNDISTITVLDITNPIAEAGVDQIIDEDTMITFDGSNSTDNVGIDNYTWTFYDNGAKTLFGMNPTYIFNTPGVYDVLLNVMDDSELWDSDNVSIDVLDITDPIANAGIDQLVNQNTLVTFNGNGSTDNTGIVNYTWSFSYNGIQVTLFGELTVFSFDRAGSIMVLLTVQDNAGNSNSDTLTLTIIDTTPPNSIISGPGIGYVHEMIEFSGYNSTDSDSEIVTYSWDFGDGSYAEDMNVTHSWEEIGNYTLVLTVTDNYELSDTYYLKITIFVSDSLDADSDGLPDGWEYNNSYDMLDPLDALLDLDCDGLNLLQEYFNNTDPLIRDTDGDQLSDGFEILFSDTDPTNPDTDNDGIGDGLEFIQENGYNGNINTLPSDWIGMTIEWANYTIYVRTNSSVLTCSFDKSVSTIVIEVSGPDNTIGATEFSIPKALCSESDITIKMDDQIISYTLTQNETHYTAYVEYNHSSHELTAYYGESMNDSGILGPMSILLIIGVIALIAITSAVTYILLRRKKKPIEPQ